MKSLTLLMGMPGSGKDTQAALLEKSDAFDVIRVGDEARKQAQTDTQLAAELESGQLADPEVINGIVRHALSESGSDANLLSDGYPRSFEQAHALEKMCVELGITIEKVLFLQLPESEVHARLKNRGRTDDTTEAIEERLKVFRTQTQPVLEYYKTKNLLTTIDATGDVQEIFQRIEEALK